MEQKLEGKIDQLDKKVSELLERLESKVDSLMYSIDAIYAKVAVPESMFPKPPNSDYGIPWNTVTSDPVIAGLPLKEFSHNIPALELAHKTLVMYLAGIGGKTIGEATRRVLARLMTNELATTFTYRGTTMKLAFFGTILDRCVKDAVKLIRPEADEKSIEKDVAEWLRQAAGRIKKRAESAAAVTLSIVKEEHMQPWGPQ